MKSTRERVKGWVHHGNIQKANTRKEIIFLESKLTIAKQCLVTIEIYTTLPSTLNVKDRNTCARQRYPTLVNTHSIKCKPVSLNHKSNYTCSTQ